MVQGWSLPSSIILPMWAIVHLWDGMKQTLSVPTPQSMGPKGSPANFTVPDTTGHPQRSRFMTWQNKAILVAWAVLIFNLVILSSHLMHKYTRKKILIGPSSCKKYILDKLEYNNPINPYQKKQVAQECHTEKKTCNGFGWVNVVKTLTKVPHVITCQANFLAT